MSGALLGAVGGLVVEHVRDPKAEEGLSYAVSGAVIGGLAGFGVPLLFWKSVQSVSLAQKYSSEICGVLNGALRKQKWKVRHLHVEGDVVCLRLGETWGKKVVDLQRVFTSATAVQIRNWNTPPHLLPTIYAAERTMFKNMGVTEVHLHLPETTGNGTPPQRAIQILIDAFHLQGVMTVADTQVAGEYVVFQL